MRGGGPILQLERDLRPARVAAVAVALAVACRGGGRLPFVGPPDPPDAGADAADADAGTGSAPIRFAVIGDYGAAGPDEADVARLIDAWGADFIVTTGDNNYPSGDRATIDRNIGQFYQGYIHPYLGIYGPGAKENRFFPTLGNHDWATPGAAPYLAYFELPHVERYYDFVRGPVHLFCMDSDPHEPHGTDRDSAQAGWLQSALERSDAPFRMVAMHHPPHSSCDDHGSTGLVQWPFAAWGADVVLAGHDHTYEHIVREGVHYVVTGLGGHSRYGYGGPAFGSRTFFSNDYGALLVEADERRASFSFVTRALQVVDEFTILPRSAPAFDVSLVGTGSTFRWLGYDAPVPEGWREADFDDSSWESGAAPLGHGHGDIVTELPSERLEENRTARFRGTFEVDDPEALREVRLGVRADDGVVAYLNGTEVLRWNVPEAGEITGEMPANSPITAGHMAAKFVEGAVDPGILVGGTNHVAVEVHQADPDGGDLAFDIVIDGTHGRALLPRGSTWRYLVAGPAPAPGWQALGFDASDWSIGTGPIGADWGDAPQVPPADPGRIDSYYRAEILVEDDAPYEAVLLRLLRDDGAIVWIDGVEVLRSNMPQGDILPETLATFDVPNGMENGLPVETAIDPALFGPGVHAIAVELHQASESNRDFEFDLEILAL